MNRQVKEWDDCRLSLDSKSRFLCSFLLSRYVTHQDTRLMNSQVQQSDAITSSFSRNHGPILNFVLKQIPLHFLLSRYGQHI